MKENINNPTQIKDYLIEKNKDLVDEMVSAKFPGITAIGDKVEIIAENLKDQTVARKQDKRGDFLKEAQKDKEISLEETTVGYLKDMVDLLTAMQNSSGGIGGINKKDEKSGLVAGAAGAGALGILGSLKKKIGKGGIKGFAKGALKGLGKIAIPLAIFMGVKDFAEGFGNAMEITGRDDFSAKMQGGLSSVISGLTFGLIDAKTISKKMDEFQEKIFEFFMDPIKFLREFSEDYLTIENIASIIDTITFGLISSEDVKKGVELIKNKLQKTFIDPFIKLKKWWLEEFNMIELIESILSPIVLSITEGWDKIVEEVGNLINEIFIKPFEKIKEGWDNLDIKGLFNRMIEPLISLKDSIISGEIFLPLISLLNEIFINPLIRIKEGWDNLDIKGFFTRMIEPLISLKDSILSGDIFAPITDWFDKFDLIEFLGIGSLLQSVKNFKDNMITILKNPKKIIMDFLGFGKDEGEVEQPKYSKQKITPIEKKVDMPSKSSNALKEKYIQAMKSIKKEGLSENNNLNVVNNSTNNNIIMDDMSIDTDDNKSIAYAY